MEALREFVNQILERKFDSEMFNKADKLYQNIMKRLVTYSESGRDLRFSRDDDKTLGYVLLRDLGVTRPISASELAIGMIFGKRVWDDSAAYWDPGQYDGFKGGVIAAYVPNIESIDEVTPALLYGILNSVKLNIIHELIHFYELGQNTADSRQRRQFAGVVKKREKHTKDVKSARDQYYNSNHELNAYFLTAFRALVDQFEENNEPNKESAEQFIQNGHECWDKLYVILRDYNVSASIAEYVSEEELRRRFASRAWGLWQDYVKKLK